MKSPTGSRFVRVLRTTHVGIPRCHPTNPTLDWWDSYDTTAVAWVAEAEIRSSDVLLDL